MSRPSISRYQEVEVQTLSAPRRLVLLYSNLLNLLRLSRRHLDDKNFEALGKTLCRSQDIIHELLVTLDHEKGGAIAEQLTSLYAWFHSELVAVGIRPSATRLDRVTALIAELHEAWSQAAQQVSEMPASSAVSG
jgi:flagellar protein FliS